MYYFQICSSTKAIYFISVRDFWTSCVSSSYPDGFDPLHDINNDMHNMTTITATWHSASVPRVSPL